MKAIMPLSTISQGSLMLCCLSEDRNENITQALVDNGGVAAAIKALRFCQARFSTEARRNDPNGFVAAGACLKFLGYCFRDTSFERNLFEKILLRGMLETLFRISPWIDQMEASMPETLSTIELILHVYIPQEFVNTRSIDALSKAITNLPFEDRNRMSESLLKESWNDLEALLVERLAISTIGAMRRSMSHCQTVNGWI